MADTEKPRLELDPSYAPDAVNELMDRVISMLSKRGPDADRLALRLNSVLGHGPLTGNKRRRVAGWG